MQQENQSRQNRQKNSLNPINILGCPDCKRTLHKITGYHKRTRCTNSSPTSQKFPHPTDSELYKIIAIITNLNKTNGKTKFNIRRTEPGITVDHPAKLLSHINAANKMSKHYTQYGQGRLPAAAKTNRSNIRTAQNDADTSQVMNTDAQYLQNDRGGKSNPSNTE